jgi:hypothetical protein
MIDRQTSALNRFSKRRRNFFVSDPDLAIQASAFLDMFSN